MSSFVTNSGLAVEELSPEITRYIRSALAEDIGPGDVTTESIVPAEGKTRAQIVAKQPGVIAGLDVAAKVFVLLDEELSFTSNVAEGAEVDVGTVVAELAGSARALLTGERTALNFLGRMSGIATFTRQFVKKIEGTGCEDSRHA